MESFVLRQSPQTPTATAKLLQSIAAHSSALCRTHHRTSERKTQGAICNVKLQLVQLNTAYLRGMLAHVQYAKRNPTQPWYQGYLRLLLPWESSYSHLTTAHSIDVSTTGTAPSHWHRVTTLLDLEQRLITAADQCQVLAARCRNQHLRLQLSKVATRITEALSANKLRPVIATTGKKKKAMTELSYVITNNDIILDPIDVHRECTSHFNTHHSINPTIFPVTIDWTSQQSVQMAQPAFQQHCTAILPPELHWTIDALWSGFTSPWTAVTADECSHRITAANSSLNHCPTLAEFKSAIARAPSSAPGISGLSYAHIKLWTAPTVSKVHQHLQTLWDASLMIPDHWHWKLLCPIPKPDKDPQQLCNLRPIMLVECLRKLWVGIIIHRLAVFLSKEKLLSDAQHGYVAHRSTVTSGLQLLDDLDDFNENRIDIFLSSWDFTKAFDSLPFSLSQLALNRSYIPPTLVKWLLQLDTDGRIIVRTPYALDRLRHHQLPNFQPLSSNTACSYFTAGGGVAQGDVHSPYVWRLFIDILLRALEYIRPQLSPFPSIHTSDFGYADDIISLCSKITDLQLKADIVSAFSIITGISISWPKLRATCHEWSNPTPQPSLTVWDNTPSSHSVPIIPGQPVRHLGFQIAPDGSSSHAYDSTLAAIRSAAAHLQRRSNWLPGAAVLKTAALQTIAQTTYTAQLSTYNLHQLQKLDSPLSKVFRHITHHRPTFPSIPLYLPTMYCGLNLPAVSTATLQAKSRILQRSLHPSTLGDSIIHRYLRYHGIQPTLQYSITVPDPTARPPGAAGYWLDNLLQHNHACGLVLRRGGRSPASTSEQQLVQLLPDHRSLWIKEGLVCLGDLYDPIQHTWITVPGNHSYTLPTIQSITFHHLLRVGQCWKPSPTCSRVYEILRIISPTHIQAREWELIRGRRAQRPVLQLTSHHTGQLLYHNLFPDHCQPDRIYTHADRHIRQGTVIRRTIWRQQSQPPPMIQPPAISPLLQRTLQLISDIFAHHPIAIYTDGAWKPTSTSINRLLLFDTAAVGGSSLIIFSDCPQWQRHPIISYSIQDDATSPTASAYTWELMALSFAALIQAHHQSPCRVLSDCQSAISTISTCSPTSALLDPHNVLLFPVANLTSRPVIQYVAAHPEARKRNCPWTQDDWGIFLADMAASNPPELRHQSHLHLQCHTYSSATILANLHDMGTWTWCYASNVPTLLAPSQLWHTQSHLNYLTHRDANPSSQLPTPPTKASWISKSWRLTAKVHRFSQSNTATNARVQRIILHWSGIGANLYRGHPHAPGLLCPHCQIPESEHHLLHDCTDPVIQQFRLSAIQATVSTIQASPHPIITNFLRSLRAAITDHPHGHLLLLGIISRTLANSLPTIPTDDIIIRQTQQHVIQLLRQLSSGGLRIIDFARSRRQIPTAPPNPPILPTPPDIPLPAQSPPSQPPDRPPINKNASTASADRLKRTAYEAGLNDEHSQLIEHNRTLTEYFLTSHLQSTPLPTPSSSRASFTNPAHHSNPTANCPAHLPPTTLPNCPESIAQPTAVPLRQQPTTPLYLTPDATFAGQDSNPPNPSRPSKKFKSSFPPTMSSNPSKSKKPSNRPPQQKFLPEFFSVHPP